MMMAGEKRCLCCGGIFVPDRRVGVRQRTCSAECRKVRKRENNKRFRRKNPDYWLGRYDVVKAWRKDHPDYQKTWRQRRNERRMEFKPGEIQAEMFSKPLTPFRKTSSCFVRYKPRSPFKALKYWDDWPAHRAHPREIQAERRSIVFANQWSVRIFRSEIQGGIEVPIPVR